MLNKNKLANLHNRTVVHSILLSNIKHYLKLPTAFIVCVSSGKRFTPGVWKFPFCHICSLCKVMLICLRDMSTASSLFPLLRLRSQRSPVSQTGSGPGRLQFIVAKVFIGGVLLFSDTVDTAVHIKCQVFFSPVLKKLEVSNVSVLGCQEDFSQERTPST